MANSDFSRSQATHEHTAHQAAHHAFGFQQVLAAVTHALASKQTPSRAAAGRRVQRDLDRKRTAASATGSWAEMLLR